MSYAWGIIYYYYYYYCFSKRNNGTNMDNVKNFISCIAHFWYNNHSTSINISRVWGKMVGVQVFRRKLDIYILRLN